MFYHYYYPAMLVDRTASIILLYSYCEDILFPTQVDGDTGLGV